EELPDAGADPAGRYSGAPVRGRHGSRVAGAEGRSEHVPLEGAEGAHPAGDTADTLIPPRASTCVGLTVDRPLQRHAIEPVRLVRPPHELPAARDGEFDNCAMHAVGAKIRVGVGETVAHQKTTRPDLA